MKTRCRPPEQKAPPRAADTDWGPSAGSATAAPPYPCEPAVEPIPAVCSPAPDNNAILRKDFSLHEPHVSGGVQRYWDEPRRLSARCVAGGSRRLKPKGLTQNAAAAPRAADTDLGPPAGSATAAPPYPWEPAVEPIPAPSAPPPRTTMRSSGKIPYSMSRMLAGAGSDTGMSPAG
jgi:hypothetical protein